MLMRVCTICGGVHKQGEACPHSKKRHEEYDKTRRNKESAKFYHSSAWDIMRKVIKGKAHGLDEYQLAEGRIVKGTLLHHIIPVEDDENKRMDPDNLIFIADKTHKFIHEEYKNGNKIKMQKKLQNIVRMRGGGVG